MPRSDLEVFEYLTTREDTSVGSDYLTYALFAHEKREWILHFEQQFGKRPTQSNIDNWIANLTDSQFNNMRITADAFFDAAAQDYLAEKIDLAREDVKKSAILAEVKAAGALRKQITVAIISTIAAPLIIGLFIVAAFAFDRNMFTPSSIVDRIFGAAPQLGAPPKSAPGQ